MATDSTQPAEDVSSFVGHLRALKRDGCSLFVVGDVPRYLFTRASESMLGDDDVDRYRAMVVTDADEESVRSRLPSATDSAGTKTRVLTCANSIRSVSSERASLCSEQSPEVGPTMPEGPETRTVSDRSELQTELFDAIEAFDRQADGVRPAQLRVGVDSLGPMLDICDEDEVRQFAERVGERVRAHNGMAHFVLTESYDSERVQRLADAFDAVVELRVQDGDGEERWHLPDSDVTMPWVSL